jgi:hypothetical protein
MSTDTEQYLTRNAKFPLLRRAFHQNWSMFTNIRETSQYHGSRDSVVRIATGYWMGDREVGIQVPVVSRIFSPPCRTE